MKNEDTRAVGGWKTADFLSFVLNGTRMTLIFKRGFKRIRFIRSALASVLSGAPRGVCIY
jgi:hypothetical protein